MSEALLPSHPEVLVFLSDDLVFLFDDAKVRGFHIVTNDFFVF